jgi:ribosomal protein S28E/S33
MLSEIIREARAGLLDLEASQKLAEVVQAVRETGKAGTLTIKLSVKQNGDRGIAIDPTVAHKAPCESLGTILMFSDDDGNLSRSDPQQAEMFSGPRGAINGGPRMIRDEEAAANS